MNEQTINTILSFTLEARDLLEQETSEQLEGIYGYLPDGSFRPIEQYPALSQLEEARETRKRIEQYSADQGEAGFNSKESRERLVRETAFTWLNRIVAFKLMEERGLLRKKTIAKPEGSAGFKMWLGEPGNEDALRLFETGDLPQNDFNEGPRQTCFRNYLLYLCKELSQEIRVLFDPDNLPSRLFPRPYVLNNLIEKIDANELSEAWKPGNEETIGWVYQGFNSRELEEAFRQARVYGKKFEAKDIPAVTQLFTPRWIVRFLVENTLGRLWLSMHPDSKLKNELLYLATSNLEIRTPMKQVSEIRLLDPACGTMHFGLVAFDLFEKMYREEKKNAGTPGWPDKASVGNESEICAAIISNNIFGLDIDLRAVQLSALTLFLRAKSINIMAKMNETKLACASIHLLGPDRLRALIDELGVKQPIYRRILENLQDRLKDSEQLGSLLRLEEDIRSLIHREKGKYDQEGRSPDLFGETKKIFDSLADRQEFWDTLPNQIEKTLNAWSAGHSPKEHIQSFFVGETIQGLKFLEIVSNGYDVVVTNPPYISRRKMNDRLKALLGDSYPEGDGDLYAAFIQRCLDLAKDSGWVGMLTMHSFMFISSYEELRKWVRERAAVETMAHAGPGLFDVGNPGTLQTTAFVLRRESDSKKRDNAMATYFRLVKEANGESKRVRFEQALENLNAGKVDPIVFSFCQKDFDAIPGTPCVYWISKNIGNIFAKHNNLGYKTPIIHGTSTYDNRRFLRYWWEVGVSNLGRNFHNWEDFNKSNLDYVPYMKGGGFCRWYGNQEFLLNLSKRGRVLLSFLEEKKDSIRGQNNIFRRGVTWSFLTSASFSARLSPGGFIFDVAGSSLFPENINLFLAILNSKFVSYALKLINPTVNHQVGDLARLPIPDKSTSLLESYVKKAIELAIADSAEDETTYDFVAPPSWETGPEDLAKRHAELVKIEKQIDDEVYRLYGICEEDRKVIEEEIEAPANGQEDGEESGESEEESEPTELDKIHLAKRWISYAVGIVIGRFEPGIKDVLGPGKFDEKTYKSLRALTDPDGILVMDKGHRDDLAARVRDALEIMLGEAGAREVVQFATEGDAEAEEELRRYFERAFFREHIRKYRKRPVYWLFQSPEKRYGVWVFHEKVTKDTLFRIRTEYVQPKVNWTESRIRELRKKLEQVGGREKRQIEKDLDEHEDLLSDLKAFSAKLKEIADRGYVPRIDDGVLLNMAPLWEIIPSWQAEPKKVWESLEFGECDWAQHAMDYWPDRVKEKCKSNKSYAIGHGLEELYVEPPEANRPKKGRRKGRQ
jgi:hypothetical protein